MVVRRRKHRGAGKEKEDVGRRLYTEGDLFEPYHDPEEAPLVEADIAPEPEPQPALEPEPAVPPKVVDLTAIRQERALAEQRRRLEEWRAKRREEDDLAASMLLLLT